MQTDNRILDDLARAASGALGLAAGMKAEVDARLRGALEQMIPNHDHVFEGVRGKGLMLGLKLKAGVEPREFVAHARDNHNLLLVAATETNTDQDMDALAGALREDLR